MDPLPSMWRTELWHPLLVHFPIALLLVGTALRLVGELRRRWSPSSFLVPGGRLLLVLGTLGAWAAVYTGTWADAAVARSLCDPTVVEAHETWGYRVGYLFSAGLLVDGVLWLRRSGAWVRRGLLTVFVLVLLGGSTGLGYVGHLGAKLVYQQAAAVHQPGADCADFE